MSNQTKTNSSQIISPMLRPGPSEIVYKNMKFLIMDRPTNSNLNNFIDELKKRNVKHVVRVCEPTYKNELLANEGITLHDWQFNDGSPPSDEIVNNWLDLLRDNAKENPDTYVAVHCVAGLGRAPVLVALALIELGMKYEDAVDEIRTKRRGAINRKQLEYLSSYKPKYKLKETISKKKSILKETKKCPPGTSLIQAQHNKAYWKGQAQKALSEDDLLEKCVRSFLLPTKDQVAFDIP